MTTSPKRRLGTTLFSSVAGPFAQPWIIGPLLFICILSGYLLSFNVDKPTHNADWYVRYQVTCGIVERNDFTIHPYQNDGRTGLGADGRLYSQYTLGQSVAMIPFIFSDVRSPVSPTPIVPLLFRLQ